MLENINSKKVAYLIGFLIGDGNFEKGGGKRTDRMGVTTTDEDVVNFINDNFTPFDTSNPKYNNSPSRDIYAKLPSYRKTFSTKFSKDFKHYGILYRKVDRVYQNIKKCDMNHFLLGFLDSDGCISYSRRKDRDRISAKIMFTHPSIKLLNKVQTFLLDELNISSSILPKKGENCFVLTFSKLDHVLKFCEWIYCDPSSIVLTRKYNKYLNLIRDIKKVYRNGTNFPSEFMKDPRYISIIGSKSKYMFVVEGKEYPLSKILSNLYGITTKTVTQRCRQNYKGWYMRPKTEEELQEFDKYMHKQIMKLFDKWKEENNY